MQGTQQGGSVSMNVVNVSSTTPHIPFVTPLLQAWVPRGCGKVVPASGLMMPP